MQTRFQKLPDVEATTTRLAALYEAAGPRLGCVLVEADMLLVLAGLRGQSQTPLFEPAEEDRQQMQQLSSLLADWGMLWRLMEPQSHPSGRQCAVFVLENLVGYSYVSRLSKMGGVTPFDPESGWEGYQAWKDATQAAILTHYDEETLGHRWLGLAFGYPDVAVDDACRVAQEKLNFRTALIRANLPDVARYRGAQPCFSFAREHANDPFIAATLDAWEFLFDGIYASEWHQLLAQDPLFLDARKAREER